jgi:hypothetical protein
MGTAPELLAQEAGQESSCRECGYAQPFCTASVYR